MGVIFREYDDKKEKLTYTLIPEVIPESIKDSLKIMKDQNIISNGYTKLKTMRKIGEVPFAAMYNFALYNGCPAEQINEYYSVNKGKNMKKLLNEFPVFKMVDKL